MLTHATQQKLVKRFALTPSEIRCIEDGWNQPVSVRVLQARARACVKLAEGRTLLQRFVYKLAEAEIPEGATDTLQHGVLDNTKRRQQRWWKKMWGARDSGARS